VSPRPSAPLKALEGLDVDIEARSFFAIREYIFKRHPSRIAGLQRPESHLVRGKRLSVQMHSILLLRILIRAPAPHGYGSSKAQVRQVPTPSPPPGPGHHHEMLLVYRRSSWPVRGYQRVDFSRSCQGRPELFDSASVAISECD
jgi:hypothetical protein